MTTSGVVSRYGDPSVDADPTAITSVLTVPCGSRNSGSNSIMADHFGGGDHPARR